jgi:hypothetical protein
MNNFGLRANRWSKAKRRYLQIPETAQSLKGAGLDGSQFSVSLQTPATDTETSHVTADLSSARSNVDLWFNSKIISFCTCNSITENPCMGILIKRWVQLPVLCRLETWRGGELIWLTPSFPVLQSLGVQSCKSGIKHCKKWTAATGHISVCTLQLICSSREPFEI